VRVVFYSVNNNPTTNDLSGLKSRCFHTLTFDPPASAIPPAGAGAAAAAADPSPLYNIPNVQWDDIGGLSHVRASILEVLSLTGSPLRARNIADPPHRRPSSCP
jgi:hypothetical protein